MPSPKTPAIVFLDNLRKVETRVSERRDLFFQPRRKVLPKTTGINEVWLHLPMLKLVSFNRDRLIHAALRLLRVGELMASPTSPRPSARSIDISPAESPPPSAPPIQCASTFPTDASPSKTPAPKPHTPNSPPETPAPAIPANNFATSAAPPDPP